MGIFCVRTVTISILVLVSLYGNATVKTDGFSDNTYAMTNTADSEVVPSIHTHRYQSGDRIEFLGTISSSQKGKITSASTVKVVKEFLPSNFKFQDKVVLTERTMTTFIETGKQQIEEQQIWQDFDGALFELSNEYGQEYVIGSGFDKGLAAIQIPYTGFLEHKINFFTMYGGHASGPVTQGSRIIIVPSSSLKTIKTNIGEYQTYHIIHKDSYQYLFTYAGNKKGSVVTTNKDIWLSPEKGIIRTITLRHNYSHSGVLQSETLSELTIESINF